MKPKKGVIVEADVEEILEITARLSTEIERRQKLINFLHGTSHDRDEKVLFRLAIAQSQVDEMQELVDRALTSCTVTSQ